MARRRVAERREILPDPIYNSQLVTKFINGMMWEGKKSVAEAIFYSAMDKIADKTGEEPLKAFKKAVDNVAPTLEVKSRRIGGATYQVPLEVSRDRRNALAIRWIVGNARNRSEKTMVDRLVGELLDSNSGRGGAVKKKDDVHRMAEANKAFAHYWFYVDCRSPRVSKGLTLR
jgi:small subunit ribosomal protein S7